jgi:hypothetical protein
MVEREHLGRGDFLTEPEMQYFRGKEEKGV